MTRLALCLIASLVLHLALLVPGTLYPRSPGSIVSTAGVTTVPALLVLPEVRIEERPSELLVNVSDGAARPDSPEKTEGSPGGDVAVDGEARKDLKRPTGLIDPELYYVRSELSQAPHVIDDVLISAPPTRRRLPWTLRIRLFLSESGSVDRVVVEDSTAPDYVEEDSVQQFRLARYSPGYIDGQRVKSQLLIDVSEP